VKIFFLELNSSHYALSRGTAITNGADLDNYSTPGNYYASTDAIAISLSNSPANGAFTMKVEYANGTGYPRQTIRQYDTGTLYTRLRNGLGVWQAWMMYPTRTEINALNSKMLVKINIRTTDTTTADDIMADGVYMCTGVTTERKFPTANGLMLVFAYNANLVFQIYYPHPGTSKPYVRMHWDNWSNWLQL